MRTASKKFIAGLVLGVMALSMMFGLAFSTLGQPNASAAQATQTATPTPANPTDAKNGTRPNAGALAEVATAFKKNFAAQLGVDEAKLDSAFSSAVNSTVDQAVKDGKLTQAQADKIKEAAKDGFKGFPGKQGGPGGHGKGGPGMAGPGMGHGMMDGRGASLDAAAKAIGVTTDELKTELKAGKSIADVAKTKNVDIQKVKDAMLAEVKTNLDQAVKDGKLTQEQADKAYQAAQQGIEKVVTATGPMGGKRGR